LGTKISSFWPFFGRFAFSGPIFGVFFGAGPFSGFPAFPRFLL